MLTKLNQVRYEKFNKIIVEYELVVFSHGFETIEIDAGLSKMWHTAQKTCYKTRREGLIKKIW